MPDRILRAGILTSDAVCGLSWPEEVFYRRLHSVVDDYGRFSADPRLLRAAAYPLQLDKVSDSDVSSWIAKCERAGLIRVYSSNSKRYLEVTKFDQRLRAKRSKWPPPDEKCGQMSATCGHMSSNAAESYSESETESDIAAERPPPLVETRKTERRTKERREPRPHWDEYLRLFSDTITRKKGLPKPYVLSTAEAAIIAKLYDVYTPEVVLACWEMAWESGMSWSEWGAKNGRSIKWFWDGIKTILDDSRYKAKAEKYRQRWGIDARSILSGLNGFVKTEIEART